MCLKHNLSHFSHLHVGRQRGKASPALQLWAHAGEIEKQKLERDPRLTPSTPPGYPHSRATRAHVVLTFNFGNRTTATVCSKAHIGRPGAARSQRCGTERSGAGGQRPRRPGGAAAARGDGRGRRGVGTGRGRVMGVGEDRGHGGGQGAAERAGSAGVGGDGRQRPSRGQWDAQGTGPARSPPLSPAGGRSAPNRVRAALSPRGRAPPTATAAAAPRRGANGAVTPREAAAMSPASASGPPGPRARRHPAGLPGPHRCPAAGPGPHSPAPLRSAPPHRCRLTAARPPPPPQRPREAGLSLSDGQSQPRREGRGRCRAR